jgi:eukaryotic-like serine/threonine-protein kinase
MPARLLAMNDRIIGHYKVLEKIGAGAMGEVFRARDERLGRDVALKLIRAASSENPDHVRRFELEARAAAALNHPNIVAIYDVGLEGGTPYIVCELLEGRTLRQQLQQGPLPVRVAIDYAHQIVRGLIAAHERRIIHRDLKPENLFVTSDGRIKILDFGVAKLQSPSNASERTVEEMTTVTKTGSIIGTIAYMSPEQLRGRPVDHRSDIFSVGGILYEMLTGRRPFRGETEVDTITAVLREEPPEVDLDQARIPMPLRQILLHCLEKEPDNRFQSARDLAFGLETLPDLASRRVRFTAPARRTAFMPWAIASLLLIATLLLAGKLFRQRPESISYHRVTFEQGTLYSARFAPGFHSVVYGAAWGGRALQLFSTVGDSLLAQPISVTNANLLAISKTGEVALTLGGMHMQHLVVEGGTLARAPLAGGSPREILEDVRWADWDPKGELAVVHHVQERDRIEYPIGHVLYQGSGWISHMRFSPDGTSIAFIDHPELWDDRGLICRLDLSGHVTTLTREWESADGVAWSANGKDIWFTAAENGYTRALLAVDNSQHVRTILQIPAGLTLQDIAPDGSVLISLDSERLVMATEARNGKAEDISWHDWDVAKEISRDGKSVLFEDASEAASDKYAVAIGRLDGTPPIKLGEGSTGGLSPDGKWAIGIIAGKPGRIMLYPVGPGQPRNIPVEGLQEIVTGSSHFAPDGKRITINAIEPGRGVRCYLLGLEGGKPIPVTPEGVNGGFVSPDGKQMLAYNGTTVDLTPASFGTSRKIPGIGPDFTPLQWSEDGKAIYGYRPGHIPARLSKVDIVTGRETPVQDVQPESTTGLVLIAPVITNRDATRFAFSYYQVFSVLYMVSGLR